jgi:YggT family protein
MLNALVFIFTTLIDLYLYAFVLRLGMQWVRADYRNPIVEFVLKITNPLVLPLRRFIPPVYKIDTATLVIFLLLQWATTGILASLTCSITPDVLTVLGLALIRGARMILNVYLFVIMACVLLSWIAQGVFNPSIAMLWNLLRQLANPILQPVQKFIPPIAGIDLTPMFVMLGIIGLRMIIEGLAPQIGGPFLCPLGAIL